MYKTWFEFTRLPFRLRPDPEFLFLPGAMELAHSALLQEARHTSGIFCVIGERGTGKTTWLQHLAGKLEPAIRVLHLRQPSVTAAEMLPALCEQLGMARDDVRRSDGLQELRRHMAEERGMGRQVVILVDDAHLLSNDSLQFLRRIAAQQPAPMMILAGTASLLARLDQLDDFHSLTRAHRVLRLMRFDLPLVRAYIAHRLSLAGAGTRSLLDEEALSEIMRYTGGTPLLINRLCDTALMLACERNSKAISSADLRDAVRELQWVEFAARPAESDKASDAAAVEPSSPYEYAPSSLSTNAVLRVSRHDKALEVVTLQPGRIVIGRGEHVNVRLNGEYISREHCCVVSTDQCSYIEDLGSTNGMIVNGERKRAHRMASGDRIQIGDHTLTYDEFPSATLFADSGKSMVATCD